MKGFTSETHSLSDLASDREKGKKKMKVEQLILLFATYDCMRFLVADLGIGHSRW